MKKAKKAATNWIYAYYQGITDGTIAVGQWIRLVYTYLIEGLEAKRFFFDQKLADDAVNWIETHCFHTEGPLAPGPLKLELWQKALVSAIFGIVDRDGVRQFREILLVVARKNGKSLLAAAICNYIWRVCGGFGAKVYCLAPKLEQADIIYNNIWQMVHLDPEWQRDKEIASEKDEHNKRINDQSMLAKRRQTDLAIPGTNSTVKKIAFSAKKSYGFNPSLCICDEIAAWEGDKGLKQYEVMKSGMGARPDGMLLSCTTSGYVSDSIYDELVKRSTRFLMGDSKETKLLPFLYMIDDVEKWNDINELRKSNPNLGVSVSVNYMLEEIAVAEGSLSKKTEFMTKYACVKQNSSLAWLTAQDVERCCQAPVDPERYRNSYCVAGIDLSQTTDLTCALVVIEKAGVLNVLAHFWLPLNKIDEATQRDGLPYDIYIQPGLKSASGDNYVDYEDCYRWMCNLVEQYQLFPLQVGYDRYSAQTLVKSLTGYGFHCDDVFQGDNLWPVLQEMEGLIKDGRINIGDNDLLKVHLLNAAIKVSVERGRGRLIKLASNLHIDGAAALSDAICVRQKWWSEIGDQLRNEG